jgi:hypothetical protein
MEGSIEDAARQRQTILEKIGAREKKGVQTDTLSILRDLWIKLGRGRSTSFVKQAKWSYDSP